MPPFVPQFIDGNKRDMKKILSGMSDGNEDAWEHFDPKQVVVYRKDVPDLLRLIVNKMEIIERHAYLQEQQHEELRGSFLRLRAAVADLTYSASYSSGTRFTCFTSTKVQIVTRLRHRVSGHVRP